jgi:hypothetical protein
MFVRAVSRCKIERSFQGTGVPTSDLSVAAKTKQRPSRSIVDGDIHCAAAVSSDVSTEVRGSNNSRHGRIPTGIAQPSLSKTSVVAICGSTSQPGIVLRCCFSNCFCYLFVFTYNLYYTTKRKKDACKSGDGVFTSHLTQQCIF